MEIRCNAGWLASSMSRARLWEYKLALGKPKVAYPMGKDLMCEMERAGPDILLLTYTHSKGVLLLRGVLSLSYSGVWRSHRRCFRWVWGHSPRPCSWSFTSGLVAVGFWMSGRKTLTGVCIYAPNISSEYSASLEKVEQVLEREPPTDSITLLGDLLMLWKMEILGGVWLGGMIWRPI